MDVVTFLGFCQYFHHCTSLKPNKVIVGTVIEKSSRYPSVPEDSAIRALRLYCRDVCGVGGVVPCGKIQV